ncbi:hypothetical protein F9L07_19855 [Pimelobacter simplex]|uniref:Uncharacterized protein n=1 Tax=Nocardioides simplex TaxID=2045 RepID=A0A7J5DVF5_NOCSI|nr:RuvA C-terminal domain-containing protein [Pimelobacter simplex]KAB2809297.1 hypothetical protein F9L07_19855 [Pimelobacter simplex]
MAASSGADVAKLVGSLRGKGLSDEDVVEGLRGMGYSKRDAEAAVGGGRGKQAAGGPGKSSPPGPTGTTDEDATGGSASGAGGLGIGSMMPSLPDTSSLTLRPPRRLDGGDLAGFFGGLLAYTLALNYLRYGPQGVKGWLSAKFFNRVTVGALAPGKGASGSAGGSGGTSWGQAVLNPAKPRVPPRVTNT